MLVLCISMLEKSPCVSDVHGDRLCQGLPITLVRIGGYIVSSILVDAAWVDKVFVQMVDKLEHVAFH